MSTGSTGSEDRVRRQDQKTGLSGQWLHGDDVAESKTTQTSKSIQEPQTIL